MERFNKGFVTNPRVPSATKKDVKSGQETEKRQGDQGGCDGNRRIVETKVRRMAMNLESTMLSGVQPQHDEDAQAWSTRCLFNKRSHFSSFGNLSSAQYHRRDMFVHDSLRGRHNSLINQDSVPTMLDSPRVSPVSRFAANRHQHSQNTQFNEYLKNSHQRLWKNQSIVMNDLDGLSQSMGKLQMSSDKGISSTLVAERVFNRDYSQISNRLSNEDVNPAIRPCVIIKETITNSSKGVDRSSSYVTREMSHSKTRQANRLLPISKTDIHHNKLDYMNSKSTETSTMTPLIRQAGYSLNKANSFNPDQSTQDNILDGDVYGHLPDTSKKCHDQLESVISDNTCEHPCAHRIIKPNANIRNNLSCNDSALSDTQLPSRHVPLTLDQVLLQYSKSPVSINPGKFSFPSTDDDRFDQRNDESLVRLRQQQLGEEGNLSFPYEGAAAKCIEYSNQRSSDPVNAYLPRWKCAHSLFADEYENAHDKRDNRVRAVGNCLANQSISKEIIPDTLGRSAMLAASVKKCKDRDSLSYESGYVSDGHSCCCGKFRQTADICTGACNCKHVTSSVCHNDSLGCGSSSIDIEQLKGHNENYNLLKHCTSHGMVLNSCSAAGNASRVVNVEVNSQRGEAIKRNDNTLTLNESWNKTSSCGEVRVGGYSPRSTGSSMTSASSAPASCNPHKINIQVHLKQNEPIKDRRFTTTEDVMRNSQFNSSFDLDELPSFARHTEASKRRSRFVPSSSIPDSLNLRSMYVTPLRQNLIDSPMSCSASEVGRTQFDVRFGTGSHRNVKANGDSRFQNVSAFPNKQQCTDADKVRHFIKNKQAEEREPEGQYHVDKKWRESLRQYESNSTVNVQWRSKSNKSHVEKRVVENAHLRSDGTHQRQSMCEVTTVDRFATSPKSSSYKETTYQINPIPSYICKPNQPSCQPQLVANMRPNKYDLNNSITDRTEITPTTKQQPIKPQTNTRQSYSNNGSFKPCKLDTVSEENILGISHAESNVKLRAKYPPITEMHTDTSSFICRYFSEANLSTQCNLLGRKGTCSDILMCPEQLPLRYKRESWAKRFRADEATNCVKPIEEFVELEADQDAPFERRNVVPRKARPSDQEYIFGEFLGRGKFGEVKKCTEKKSNKELAAKFVPVRSENDRANVYNEVDVMNSLQHPRLLQLYEAYDCENEIILIMELINGGELFERVIDDDFILTEMLCEVYVRQICEGIAFMHKENFLHLDMKPENILCINRNGHRIKIIDFGLARKFKPGDTLRILFGTPEFVAPEVVSYEKIGQGTDLWSVGVICYVLLSGLSPFMGENDAETYNNINHVEYDFDDEAFEEISDDAKDFISKLLILRPEKRMTAEECLRHNWLTRHENHVHYNSDSIKINTRKLKRFVIRRRWQKAVNVLLALKRMGMSL